MEKIKTATGKIFDVDMIATNPLPERCYICITGKTAKEITSVFDDPLETIEMQYGEESSDGRFRPIYKISGFNKMHGISEMGSGYRVTLRKE